MNQVESLQRLGNAESLKSVQSVDLAQWDWGSSGKTVPATVPLDPKARSQAIADAFQEAVSTNPQPLNKTVADAARFMKVPPTALQAAFNQLAAQTGVKLVDDGGNPRTMQAILSDVPASQGNKLLDGWVKSLPRAVQQTLLGVAVRVVLATGGVRGLAERFQLQANLIKSPQGQVASSVVPSQQSNGVAGQLSGQWCIPFNKKRAGGGQGVSTHRWQRAVRRRTQDGLGRVAPHCGQDCRQPTGWADLGACRHSPRRAHQARPRGLGPELAIGGQGWSVKGQIDTSCGYLLQGQLQFNL